MFDAMKCCVVVEWAENLYQQLAGGMRDLLVHLFAIVLADGCEKLVQHCQQGPCNALILN